MYYKLYLKIGETYHGPRKFDTYAMAKNSAKGEYLIITHDEELGADIDIERGVINGKNRKDFER